MATKRQDAAQQGFLGIARRHAVLVDADAFGQWRAEMRMQHDFAPLYRRRSRVDDDRSVGRRKTDAIRVRTQCRPHAARRHDIRLTAGEMHGDKSRIDDLFDIIGVAAAVIAVIDADNSKSGGLGLFDCGLRRFENRDVSNIVAAVQQCRNRGLMHHAYRFAGQFRLGILCDGENSGQARKGIAAQRIVDQLAKNGVRVFCRKSDIFQRFLAKLRSLRHAHPHGPRRGIVE